MVRKSHVRIQKLVVLLWVLQTVVAEWIFKLTNFRKEIPGLPLSTQEGGKVRVYVEKTKLKQISGKEYKYEAVTTGEVEEIERPSVLLVRPYISKSPQAFIRPPVASEASPTYTEEEKGRSAEDNFGYFYRYLGNGRLSEAFFFDSNQDQIKKIFQGTQNKKFKWLFSDYGAFWTQMRPMADAYLESNPGLIIIVLDWSKVSSKYLTYNTLVQFAYKSSKEVNTFIKFWTSSIDSSIALNSHFIGLGIGCIYFGFSSVGVNRMTLLDPTGRCWGDEDKKETPECSGVNYKSYISNSHATFVDAVLTSRDSWSLYCRPSGQQPIYHVAHVVNFEGRFQPNCEKVPFSKTMRGYKDDCSHYRSLDLWTWSIKNPQALNGSFCEKTATSIHGCTKYRFAVMGDNNPIKDVSPKPNESQYFLVTNPSPPYTLPARCYKMPNFGSFPGEIPQIECQQRLYLVD